LKKWVTRSVDFVATLPKRAKKASAKKGKPKVTRRPRKK
jgi:hypothetical protein